MVNKRVRTLLVTFLVIVCMVSSVSAAFVSSQAVPFSTMSNGGNKYIYSDNPEMLWDGTGTQGTGWVNNFNGRSGAYTIEETLTANTLYDAYFYHINKTTSKNIKVGVYIYATTAGTVTTLNKVVLKSGTSSFPDYEMCANVETGYQTSTNYTTQSLATGTGTFIASDQIAPLNLVNGHVMFKVSSSMKCRIVFYDASVTTINPSTLGKAIAMSSGTTATFSGDVKYANYNYNSVSSNGSHGFYLATAGSNMSFNIGEYDTGSNAINSNNQLMGNYGRVYNMVLSNCAGKTLRITPDWGTIWNSSSGTWLVREALAYCPGGSTSSWTYKKIHSIYNARVSGETTPTSYTGTEPTYIDVVVPSGNNSYNFKFILPGSNFGNIYFKFIN
jgi:hypothetical protein